MNLNNAFSIMGNSVAVYLFIIMAIRLFGKKELAQLSVIDLVFILLISNAVQNAMVGPDTTLTGGLVAAGALFVANYVLKWAIYRFESLNKILQGEPIILIYKGVLNFKNLEKNRISVHEIEAAIREHGVEHIEKVDLAMLEVDGNISVMSNDFQTKTTKRRKAHKPSLQG